MALTSKPVAEDLVSVLGELSERMHPNFGPWCRSTDAQAVRRAIIDRTDDLRKLIDQAVRLVRLAALASVRDYTEFLYLDVAALRPRLFKAATEQAARRGRFQQLSIEVGSEGVRLREPAMALSAEAGAVARGYELTYAQMPRLAVFIDVLHNTLGYHVVAEAARGIIGSGPAANSAAQVAADLRARFNAWLAPRLESAHRRRQAKVLHAFLTARNALSSDAIDDEAVFAFWRSRADTWNEQIQRARSQGSATNDAKAVADTANVQKAARDEGFRVFRSAVKAVLRYRQALTDAAAAHAVEHATQMESASDLDHFMSTAETGTGPFAIAWQSPLVALARPPADRIKWLTEKEYRWLTNYLGRSAGSPADEDEIETRANEQPAEALDGKAGLMEGRPYDLALSRTLQRIDVFAPIQASLIAGLKKRRPIGESLKDAMSSANRATYLEAMETYKGIRDQIEMEALAALDILAKAGEPMTLLLMEYFEGLGIKAALGHLEQQLPQQVVTFAGRKRAGVNATAVQDDDEDENDELLHSAQAELPRIGLILRRIFSGEHPVEGPLATLIGRSAAARKRISRAGFKTDEALTPEIQRALASAIPAIIELISQLDRLIERLERAKPDDSLAADRRRFLEVLELIYVAT